LGVRRGLENILGLNYFGRAINCVRRPARRVGGSGVKSEESIDNSMGGTVRPPARYFIPCLKNAGKGELQ